MRQFLFILGRDPSLSLLELLVYCESRHLPLHIHHFTSEYARVTLPDSVDLKRMISDLGGTVKICCVLASPDAFTLPGKNKITYGLSALDDASIEELHLVVKSTLKKEEIHGVYRGYLLREPTKSHRCDLDLVVFPGGVAQTVAVSSPKAYKERDAQRPLFRPE